MKLATISAVIGLGVLAACGDPPVETQVASYGDTAAPAQSQPAARSEEPAQDSASAAIAEARAAAASAQAKEEKPGAGALAFSPAQESDETATDTSRPEDQDAQVAALPKQVQEPATEESVTLSEQPAEPAAEETEAPVEIAARPPQEPAAQPLERPYGVQLAAYRQPSGAVAAWIRLLRVHPDLLEELSNTIRRADLGATRGVVHQLRVGPFVGEAQARALCETLKTRGADCFVVTPLRQAREGR